MNIDTMYELVDIEGVDGRDARYAIKALVINGHCPTTTALVDMGRVEAGLIRDGIRIVGSVPKEQIRFHKRISVDRKQRGIFEIANRGGGKARLFCFYLELEIVTIVCMDSFWKNDRKKDQSKAFDAAAKMMGEYLKWRSNNPQS